MTREDLDHSLAVLRPRAGDVLVLYANLTSIESFEIVVRFMCQVRQGGVRAGILPQDCVLHQFSTEDEVQQQLDQWLRPFGYRAVRREDLCTIL